MSPWDVLVPPLGGDAVLRRRVAEAMKPRLRRVLRAWKGPKPALPPTADGRARGFVHAAEEALHLLEAAKAGKSSDLIAKVADLGLLAALAPRGRIPADFATRAAHTGREQLARLARVWESGPARHEDADLGRRRGSEPLPTGTISVGAVVRTRGIEVTVRGDDPRFRENVFHALAFLGAVWPEAAQMVIGRTWRVVPVEERGIVSYSSPTRPGVTWIQRALGRGRGSEGAMGLAEHLLHEGTHQRVHDLEVLAPIAAREEDGPRFYSPWRREWRPLRGLLHGACTFTVGAGYFEHTLQALDEARIPLHPGTRPWLSRRFLEEMENVRVALRYLRRAEVPPAGRRLLATVSREHAALRAAARRRRASLGRKDLALVEEHARELASQPLRWG